MIKASSYSHSLVREDSVSPAGLEISLDLTIAVHLDTTEYVFRPINHALALGVCQSKGIVLSLSYHAILPKSGGFLLCSPSDQSHYAVSKIPMKGKEDTHVTQMHIAPSTTASSPSLIRCTPCAPRVRILLARSASQRRAAGARKCLRRCLEVVIPDRVGLEHLVQDRKKPAVLAKGARCGRNFCGRSYRQVGHRWVCLQVGQEVRGRGGQWVGEDFLISLMFSHRSARANVLFERLGVEE